MTKIDLIFSETQIKSKLFSLNSSKRIKLKNKNFINSAVLFTLIPNENNSYDIIIIQRSNSGSTHPGEMAFPGGKFNQNLDNNLIDTALRETEEEIGISKNQITILGCLDDIPTVSKYIITPIIAKIVGSTEFTLEEREVVDIIKVPISFFVDETHFSQQFIYIKDTQFPIYYYDYYDIQKEKSYIIWGATAKIIIKFINRIYEYNISKYDNQDLDLKKFRLLKNLNIKEKKDF